MGAYNWIIIKEKCPKCNQTRIIKCQTHIASDFGGDDSGRFCEREYKLGEEMAWYPISHKKYLEWKVNGKISSNETLEEIDYECCYSQCTNCRVNLYVVIKFQSHTPKKVIDVGFEENWPKDYFL